MKRIAKIETKSNTTENANGFIQDSQHWTRSVNPTTDHGKLVLKEPYNPITFLNDDNGAQELAAISLKEIYESIQERTFENGLGDIAGLYNLIKHNPHFQPEANALRALAIGEDIMQQFLRKVENL